MILIDSNIWIFALDADLPEHTRVADQVRQAMERQRPLLLPSVVQIEVVHYLRRQMGNRADAALSMLLGQDGVRRPLDHHVVQAASNILRLPSETGIGARDAAVLHHARQDAATLWTHDRSLARAAEQANVPTFDPVTA